MSGNHRIRSDNETMNSSYCIRSGSPDVEIDGPYIRSQTTTRVNCIRSDNGTRCSPNRRSARSGWFNRIIRTQIVTTSPHIVAVTGPSSFICSPSCILAFQPSMTNLGDETTNPTGWHVSNDPYISLLSCLGRVVHWAGPLDVKSRRAPECFLWITYSRRLLLV